MNRLCIATRGIASWRGRLANPDRQWRRGYSAFETAVSWELASKRDSGLPPPIEDLFRGGPYGDAVLRFGVAEHQIVLPGGKAASQCDVWGWLDTSVGGVSLAVEAKANEPFGTHALSGWLAAATSARSANNRRLRWDHIRGHLPSVDEAMLTPIAYQLLHRCAAAVIEAKRLKFGHAAFVVQAFRSPLETFSEFAAFGRALGVEAEKGRLYAVAPVDGIDLNIGWVDCRPATDSEVAATA